MSKPSPAIHSLPSPALGSLRKLGADLATARKRRRQSLKDWAQRLQVSIPTLMRMEKGDPAVSMGVYATALWLLNRHDSLSAAADPKEDLAALETEVRTANQRNHASGGERG
jgi:transcriptional regulator with XRE-family HTH domain